MRIALSALVVVPLGLGACSAVPNLPPAPAVPAPLSAATPLPAYRIQIGDVLGIRFLVNPELNEEVTVRPDGHISTTDVKDERAAGRTIPELTDTLLRDYSHDVQNPRITVEVKSFAPTRIYVGGEVNTPGEFITVGPTLTLSQAVARAGGVKLSSAETSVFIIRRIGDTAEFLGTNYWAVEHARDPAADVELAPYDVVYVPKSGIAEVYKWYNQYIGQFANPSVTFTYLINPAAASGVVPVK